MHWKIDYYFTPWEGVEELLKVYSCIYDSIVIPSDEEQSSLRRFLIEENDPLLNARQKICNWKTRCAFTSQSVLIHQHLSFAEILINILLEEHKLYQNSKQSHPSFNNDSILYNLYSIGVINFCNVLSAYSEQNSTISIKNLAKIYNCPDWIVECRHKLSHANSDPPSTQTLFNAITFGLKWMRKYFWDRQITALLRPLTNHNELEIRKQPKDSRESIKHQVCIFLLTDCSKKRAAHLLSLVRFSMLENPNNCISVIAEILIHEVPNLLLSSNDAIQTKFFDRAARILTLMFSFNPINNLILLINLMIDSLIDYQSSRSAFDLETNETVQNGYIWLAKIFDSLRMPSDTRKTRFEQVFSVFTDVIRIKLENQLLWHRLFFKTLQLYPNKNLLSIIHSLYWFIDDLMLKNDFNQIVYLMSIYVRRIDEPSSEQIVFDESMISNVEEIRPSNNRWRELIENSRKWNQIPLGSVKYTGNFTSSGIIKTCEVIVHAL
ncbi:Serine/threonine-protein phosphatase BSU1 [Sarcoptes scabiei]|nr:Serine/threonine-protein phosphatase BSU1 [Sarcoptes scabiei]